MSELKKLPVHIAIIPDGNRRWAKERDADAREGHEEGAKNIEKIVRKGLELEIKHMSFWGSSINNLEKRPLREKQSLLEIYKKYFEKLINSEDVHKNEARINIMGRWREQFPGSLKKVLEDGIEKTKKYKKYNLNFFLAYNGDDEMVEAVRKIAENHRPGEKVEAQTIKNNLMTKDLPPVDFLIRTGGEPHLSVGFMMWDIANAQLYFSEKLFPDFDDKEFELAIKDYQKRGRRMGR